MYLCSAQDWRRRRAEVCVALGVTQGLGRERGDRGDCESPLTKFISVMKTILTSVESTLNWGNKESGNSVLIVL